MFIILANVISFISQLYTFIVLAYVILSYFMSPYHPVRVFINKLVEPLLMPIRRVVPLLGMMDFSPAILIILEQLISGMVINFLISLR